MCNQGVRGVWAVWFKVWVGWWVVRYGVGTRDGAFMTLGTFWAHFQKLPIKSEQKVQIRLLVSWGLQTLQHCNIVPW